MWWQMNGDLHEVEASTKALGYDPYHDAQGNSRKEL